MIILLSGKQNVVLALSSNMTGNTNKDYKCTTQRDIHRQGS